MSAAPQDEPSGPASRLSQSSSQSTRSISSPSNSGEHHAQTHDSDENVFGGTASLAASKSDQHTPAKRKVQWADHDDVIRLPGSTEHTSTHESISALVSRKPAEEPNEDYEQTYVDEHGMLQRAQTTAPVAAADANATNEQGSKPEEKQGGIQYLKSEIYNPIEYGDFRNYMKHKRAKLKVQEASLLEEEAALLQVGANAGDDTTSTDSRATDAEIEAMGGKKSDILKGCCVYINGQTHPPYSELRRLLVLHGGDLMAYLDQKTPVTHIIASNLTPKKRIEFKDYKVVLPGWILESIELGRRADWRKWRCDAITGSNGHTSESMIGKPTTEHSSNLGTAHGQWRNLNHVARMPRPLPRIGDEDESPWGKPSNQTTLLQGFPVKPQTTRTPMSAQPLTNVPSGLSSAADVPKQHAVSRNEEHGVKAVRRTVRFTDDNAQATISTSTHAAPAATTPVPTLPSPAIERPPENSKAEGIFPATSPEKTTKTDPFGPKYPQNKSSGPQTPKKQPSGTDYSVGTDPASKSAATTFYASRPSNTHAARLLASPSWRERNTATSEGFLAGYFANTWKTSLQDMVSSALREAGRPLGSSDLPKGVARVIFHIDFDSFFVATRPDLINKPVVARDENRPADNQSSSTSEIASCTREFGIRNGMSLGQAKQVETIPYNFEAYNSISLTFYAFLLEHSDALQAVSALVDTMRSGECEPGSHLGSQGERQLAEAFRDEIRERCGCEASIGIGSNILLAPKPGGAFHLTNDAKQPFLNDLDVDDLHGIGWSLRDRLREMFGTINILSQTSERRLKGRTIWEKMHGIDADRLEGNKLRQSVGSHVNYGIRFLDNHEAEAFVDGMCLERARAVKLRGRQVSVQVMDAPVEAPKFLGHGVCDTHHRSVQVSGPGGIAIDDEKRIKAAAWPLIRDLKADPKELRGIAISLNKLEPAEGNPVSPVKPDRGQSVLTFGKTAVSSPQKKAEVAQPTTPLVGIGSDDGVESKYESIDADDMAQLDEAGIDLPDSFQKGPDAATPRRPNTKEAEQVSDNVKSAISGSGRKELPSPTQLMLPSRSQLDPDVLASLPTQYRKQIETKYGTSQDFLPAAAELEDEVITPKPSQHVTAGSQTGSQNRPRVLPRSTPTTPQKAKLAPTPAVAEALMLPSASQIDPSVLAELPMSIRREIERQTRLRDGRDPDSASSSTTSTPTKAHKRIDGDLTRYLRGGGGGGDESVGAATGLGIHKGHGRLFRSVSESPSKKRIINRLLLKHHPGSGVAPEPPATVDKDAILAIDPTRIPDSELSALGIDSEVFRALPADLQREMFRHHSEQRKSERARFKAGKTNTWEEITHAERRRRETLRAAHHHHVEQRQLEARLGRMAAGLDVASASTSVPPVDEEDVRRNPPMFLVARPRSRVPTDSAREQEQKRNERPSIRGLSSEPEVRQLIEQWVQAFAKHGPRAGDVDRIATYLAQLVANSRFRVEDAESATSLIAWTRYQVVRFVAGFDGDVRNRVDGSSERAWQEAIRSIEQKVQLASRDVFGEAELQIPP
ncbi:LOW QUALITY PROTEIN: hypothetical protein BCV70DRAFT_213345 [Testicularia cyperi]|uniref:DNA repair protein REV1 n=1 Tax=Testicularia cyperi TaxID=1882483 RepID=A0A317XHL4_9BASI|nr:LOW QUALITY PROTEIN: hypothetical protein BCV70DRAFT_213345 [Testicularia cyperi]